jgi:hypothetical protein
MFVYYLKWFGKSMDKLIDFIPVHIFPTPIQSKGSFTQDFEVK